MKPNESLVGQSVRSLQTMLRVISEADGTIPTVIPDGIYGQSTMEAVSAFQRHRGLSSTGIADQATWDRIAEAYKPALDRIGQAEPIEIVLDPVPASGHLPFPFGRLPLHRTAGGIGHPGRHHSPGPGGVPATGRTPSHRRAGPDHLEVSGPAFYPAGQSPKPQLTKKPKIYENFTEKYFFHLIRSKNGV